METRIKGIYFSKKGPNIIDIYGYSSKGLPGIEIIGLGRKGQSIREKFIYISKCRKLAVPLKRYVLCIEDSDPTLSLTNNSKLKDEDGASWLELPLLLLFWCLAGVVNVNNLEACLVAGKILVDGRIIIFKNDFLLTKIIEKKMSSEKSFRISNSREEKKGFTSITVSTEMSTIVNTETINSNNNNNCERFKIHSLPLDKIFEKIDDLHYEVIENL
ncbi:MAG: hypothetical protein HQK51_02620 [Oligoflexia bacterium]|nr:hypothetical protein [Oligoflexia bacterium]